MLEIGIDPRNDEVDLVDKAEQWQRDTIRRRAIRHKGSRAICQHRFRDADGSFERFDMPRSGPVAVRREDGHLTDLPHGLREGKQSGRLNAVIIGYENMHELISDLVDLRCMRSTRSV